MLPDAGSFPPALHAFGALDREAVLHGVVGGGGALLLAYAAWAHAQARATAPQLRGLVASGVGFLLSTAASTSLRDRGTLGIGVSLAGSALVLWGARTLLRERRLQARATWPRDERTPR